MLIIFINQRFLKLNGKVDWISVDKKHVEIVKLIWISLWFIYLDDEDYPFVGDKCLTKKCFYLIEGDVNIENTEWIELNELIQKLDAQRYNNPRVQSITDEIIEIMLV